jgi:hypothetical protein
MLNFFDPGLTVSAKKKKRIWFFSIVVQSSGQFGALEMIVVLMIN